jgi:hypothetical protein
MESANVAATIDGTNSRQQARCERRVLMKKRFLVYSFLLLLLSISTATTYADMTCRSGHLFHFDDGPYAGTTACNPGGENCLRCEDEIFVLG